MWRLWQIPIDDLRKTLDNNVMLKSRFFKRLALKESFLLGDLRIILDNAVKKVLKFLAPKCNKNTARGREHAYIGSSNLRVQVDYLRVSSSQSLQRNRSRAGMFFVVRCHQFWFFAEVFTVLRVLLLLEENSRTRWKAASNGLVSSRNGAHFVFHEAGMWITKGCPN